MDHFWSYIAKVTPKDTFNCNFNYKISSNDLNVLFSTHYFKRMHMAPQTTVLPDEAEIKNLNTKN